ncbi:hypothetical protein AX15_001918 [Amanita polypyramis BW_CC]|nr:hypothetical protein AX15_001918 [Amanita polypyramis BW_CC]
MRSIFAYSLLLVQLAFVHLVAAQSYAIGNDYTKFWIGDYVGQEIRTSYGSPNPPSDALYLTIGTLPAQSGQTTNSTIYESKSGLYVGLESSASAGSRLIWVKDEYQWTFYKTSNGSYFIRNSNLYWFDNYTIPTVIEVDPYASFYYWTLKSGGN